MERTSVSKIFPGEYIQRHIGEFLLGQVECNLIHNDGNDDDVNDDESGNEDEDNDDDDDDDDGDDDDKDDNDDDNVDDNHKRLLISITN